jgi:5-methylcytosine-specific restriction endonuclease McrA
MSTAWRKGSTRAWRTLRRAILIRDQYQCKLALPGEWPVWGGMARCTVVATQVHHTRGRAVTGDDPAYLVAACKACNLKVGQPTTTDPTHMEVTEW